MCLVTPFCVGWSVGSGQWFVPPALRASPRRRKVRELRFRLWGEKLRSLPFARRKSPWGTPPFPTEPSSAAVSSFAALRMRHTPCGYFVGLRRGPHWGDFWGAFKGSPVRGGGSAQAAPEGFLHRSRNFPPHPQYARSGGEPVEENALPEMSFQGGALQLPTECKPDEALEHRRWLEFGLGTNAKVLGTDTSRRRR